MNRTNYTFFFFIALTNYFAQQQSNVWCFGYKASVNFSTGVPNNISPSSIQTMEGCASIADTNGNLLFYTDGVKVWDKSHAPMQNAFGLKGSSTSTQSAIIVPVINNKNQYLIFTTNIINGTDYRYGLHYSIVDMDVEGNGDASNKLGDVLISSKNTKLLDSTGEKLTAVMDGYLTGYWIITTHWYGYKFYAYHVTCDGVNPVPVISEVTNRVSAYGYLKASHDGRVLAAALRYQTPSVGLYNFDAKTGKVSDDPVLFSDNERIYGIEFSPNDSIIYTSNDNYPPNNIRQYQRFSKNIEATENTIYSSIINVQLGALQLANDGNIYFTNNDKSLGQIKNPNSLNPVVTSNGVNFGTSGQIRATFGLPNFFNIYVTNNFWNQTYTKTICKGDSIEIGAFESAGNTYTWAPNSSIISQSTSTCVVAPDSSTNFVLTITTPCLAVFKINFFVHVNPLPTPAFYADKSSSCGSLNTLLEDTSSQTFKRRFWALGDGNFIDSLPKFSHIYDSIGSYTVKLVVEDFNGCVSDTLVKQNYINVYGFPTANFNVNPKIVSNYSPIVNFNDSSFFSQAEIIKWDWDFGDEVGMSNLKNTTYTYLNAGKYDVRLIVSDSNNCSDTAFGDVIVLEEFWFFAPNTFSPNNDEVNDVFKIETSAVKEYEISVFNRWGEVVYYSNDVNSAWDGKIINSNQIAKEDVYVYSIRLVSYSKNSPSIYNGIVHLIR